MRNDGAQVRRLINVSKNGAQVRRLEEVQATGIAPTIAQVKGSKMKFRPIQRGMFERIVIDGVTIDMAGTPFKGGKGPPVMVY